MRKIFVMLSVGLLVSAFGHAQDRTSPTTHGSTDQKSTAIESPSIQKDAATIQTSKSAQKTAKTRSGTVTDKPVRTEEMLRRKSKAPLLSEPQ